MIGSTILGAGPLGGLPYSDISWPFSVSVELKNEYTFTINNKSEFYFKVRLQ